MKCPRCQEDGLTSVITPSHSMVTDMYCAPFYDEAGVYHSHDMNAITQGLKCSNGHAGTRVRYPRCPASGCAWNADYDEWTKWDDTP